MPGTVIHPYLTFGGRCDEALAFYQKALGATVEMLMRFSDSPDPMPPGMLAPGFETKVMHCSFRIGGVLLMASDGCNSDGGFQGFSLALGLPTVAEVDHAFKALAEGGTVGMPLAKTFWNERFGMVTDRFGVAWMVSLAMQ